jgi:hypothetical protein
LIGDEGEDNPNVEVRVESVMRRVERPQVQFNQEGVKEDEPMQEVEGQ